MVLWMDWIAHKLQVDDFSDFIRRPNRWIWVSPMVQRWKWQDGNMRRAEELYSEQGPWTLALSHGPSNIGDLLAIAIFWHILQTRPLWLCFWLSPNMASATAMIGAYGRQQMDPWMCSELNVIVVNSCCGLLRVFCTDLREKHPASRNFQGQRRCQRPRHFWSALCPKYQAMLGVLGVGW